MELAVKTTFSQSCRPLLPDVSSRAGAFGRCHVKAFHAPSLLAARERRTCVSTFCASPAASTVATEVVTSVGIDTYDAEMEKAGEKLVVLDMYTQWCGPCKLIAPKIEALAAEMTDVVFMKLDCNQVNKALAKSLGVKSVPTFKLIRNKTIVAEVIGAKYDVLVEAIKAHH